MFRLTPKEQERLRFQIGTSKGRGGRRYLPHVFTQEGVTTLSSVLRSQREVKMNEPIELPWALKINPFIRWPSVIFALWIYYSLLDEYLKTRMFTPVYFIPISIGAFIFMFFPRSIKCVTEGISITHCIGWTEIILWEDIKTAQIGKKVRLYRGAQYITNFLSIKAKSGRTIDITFQFFNPEKIPTLFRILSANTVKAVIDCSI